MPTAKKELNLNGITYPIKDGAIITRLELVGRLDKDIKHKAITIDRDSIKQIVKAYYRLQKMRIGLMNQVREIKTAGGKDYELLQFLYLQYEVLEKQISQALDTFTDLHPLMLWTKAQVGMGPVLTAGLFGQIDPAKSAHAGHLIKYAGLAPGDKRRKGEKLTYNPDLKDLCWKIGTSFMKQSFRDNAYYGKLYLQRKEYELARNEQGLYAEQAKKLLEHLKDKESVPYMAAIEGKLCESHIIARAQRWTVKIFLNHYLYVAHKLMGKEPAKPYAIAILGHGDEIPIPRLDVLDRLVAEATRVN